MSDRRVRIHVCAIGDLRGLTCHGIWAPSSRCLALGPDATFSVRVFRVVCLELRA